MNLEHIHNFEDPATYRNLANLHRRLVSRGEQKTEIWRRAVFPVPAAEVPSWFSRFSDLGLKRLIDGHRDLFTGVYPPTQPSGISLWADDYDYTDSPARQLLYRDLAKGLAINFSYINPDKIGNLYSLIVRLQATQFVRPRIRSYVFDFRNLGTGYEGHDRRMEQVTKEELQALYRYISGAENLDTG